MLETVQLTVIFLAFASFGYIIKYKTDCRKTMPVAITFRIQEDYPNLRMVSDPISYELRQISN